MWNFDTYFGIDVTLALCNIKLKCLKAIGPWRSCAIMLKEALPLTLCRFRYSSRNIVRNASHISKSSTKAFGNCHDQRNEVQHLHCIVSAFSNYSRFNCWESFNFRCEFLVTFSEAARSLARWCPHEFAIDGEVLGSAHGLRHRRRYHGVCSILPIQLRCV